MKHSIFISYRREGGFETAKMIQEKLKSFGYKVFLDYEALRSGKFNEQLYAKIEECNDFIVICSPNCFERCKNLDDWLRLEIEHALKHNKNIVPVLLRNFEWSESIPSSLKELPLMQGVAASEELFDAFIKKLQSYLITKRKILLQYRSLLLSIFFLLLVLTSFLYYFLHYKNQRQIEQVSSTIVSDITTKFAKINVELLNIDDVHKRWSKFYHAAPHLNEKKYLIVKDELIKYLDYRISQVDTVSYNILNAHYLDVMSESNVPLEDLQIFYSMAYQTNIKEVISYYKFVKQWIQIPPTGWLNQMEEMMQTRTNILEYCTLNLYFCILEMFSHMPDKSLEPYYKTSAELIAFPDVEIITQESANARAEKYMRKLEQAVMDFAEITGHEKRSLDLQEKKVEKEQLQQKSILVSEKSNKIKEESVAQMKEQLTIKKASLAQNYDNLRKKCKPVVADDEWMVWGKMIRLLSVKLIPEALENLAYYEKMNMDNGLDVSNYTIPSKAFIENKLFKGYHGGVVVFGFKDNKKHSSLEVGDVIVAVNDSIVIDSDDFLRYRKECCSQSSVMKVLRLEDQYFKELFLTSTNGDPLIGVSSLIEKLN